MTSKELIISLQNGVRLIKINRPKTKNALNDYCYRTITETLNEDAKNDNIVVTILTGAGEYYCSGFDIKSAMSHANDEESNKTDVLNRMIQAFITYPKLLISLVNGPCIGIGTTTAALCDIVYASDRATFETPFVKIGLCAEGCSSYTFPRIMGRSKASEMLLLGLKITAKEAHQFGFVAKVIPHKDLDEFLVNLNGYGELPVNSVKISKKLIVENFSHVLEECNRKEMAQLEESLLSEEFSNGIVRFMSRKSKL